jgi:Mlc titration factor MtfA (ptsG expression regulator)
MLTWLTRLFSKVDSDDEFPVAWLRHIDANVGHFAYLARPEQVQLLEYIPRFIAGKHWEGCRGLVINDEIKVTIAAHACLMLLGMEHDFFSRAKSILVYPSAFLIAEQYRGGEVAFNKTTPVIGQSVYRGPVILSWDEVVYCGRNPGTGFNVVFHEFAHQLDYLDGLINGTPPLENEEEQREWYEVMTAEYEALIKDTSRGRPTVLDPYGTKDEAEFFAVATECFFDRPVDLLQKHPRLYQLLRAYFGQDPANRFFK